jgi:hypothetical protein
MRSDRVDDAYDVLDGCPQLATEADELRSLLWGRNDLFHPRMEYPVFDLEEFVLADELRVDSTSSNEEERM